jgi:hypothetical protein
MRRYGFTLSIILLVFCLALNVSAQNEETGEDQGPVQVLTQKGYDKTSPAVVKIVSDAGRRIGSGVLVGVHADRIGFVLTAYGAVAGLETVAVILKNHPDGLLGHVVEKWIDHELDLTIIAVKNFPEVKDMITIGDSKKVESNSIYTVVSHFETRDWYPTPLTVATAADERFFSILVDDVMELEGAPLLLDNGKMIALTLGVATTALAEPGYARAVKSNEIKPVLKEWFKDVKLKQKWKTSVIGFAPWVWAVGGGMAAGVVTVLGVSGGDAAQAPPVGLPTPPDPPAAP